MTPSCASTWSTRKRRSNKPLLHPCSTSPKRSALPGVLRFRTARMRSGTPDFADFLRRPARAVAVSPFARHRLQRSSLTWNHARTLRSSAAGRTSVTSSKALARIQRLLRSAESVVGFFCFWLSVPGPDRGSQTQPRSASDTTSASPTMK